MDSYWLSEYLFLQETYLLIFFALIWWQTLLKCLGADIPKMGSLVREMRSFFNETRVF